MYYAFYSDLNLTFPFTVKVESEQEAIDLQHTVASFLNLDVTKVDRSNAFVYSSRLGKVWMESVMAAMLPRKGIVYDLKVAWMIVKPGRKQWFDNLSSEEAKATVTEQEKRKVIDEMMRRLKESGLRTEVTPEEEKIVP